MRITTRLGFYPEAAGRATSVSPGVCDIRVGLLPLLHDIFVKGYGGRTALLCGKVQSEILRSAPLRSELVTFLEWRLQGVGWRGMGRGEEREGKG